MRPAEMLRTVVGLDAHGIRKNPKWASERRTLHCRRSHLRASIEMKPRKV